jgi:hypothetical protein
MALLSLVALVSALTHAQAEEDRDYGDSRVIAEIPSEPYPGNLGFPESVVINGNRAYVSTPATFGTVGTPPARIYAFDVRYGTLERTYEIQGQDKTLFVTNHALYSQNRDHFVLFDVFVNEPGHPAPRPFVP